MKRLLFLETLFNDDKTIVWECGKEYAVIYEGKFTYMLESQNGTQCGIEKSLEGDKYLVIEHEKEPT